MNRMTLIDSTLPKAVQADSILRTLRREKREATADEQSLIDEVEAAREIIIQVCVIMQTLALVEQSTNASTKATKQLPGIKQ